MLALSNYIRYKGETNQYSDLYYYLLTVIIMIVIIIILLQRAI